MNSMLQSLGFENAFVRHGIHKYSLLHMGEDISLRIS